MTDEKMNRTSLKHVKGLTISKVKRYFDWTKIEFTNGEYLLLHPSESAGIGGDQPYLAEFEQPDLETMLGLGLLTKREYNKIRKEREQQDEADRIHGLIEEYNRLGRELKEEGLI